MSERLRVDIAGLSPGTMRIVTGPDRKLLVCNADGTFYAIENRCPHALIGLEMGNLRGHVLECPLHGGTLDVRDGKPLRLPIRKPVGTYPVFSVDGRVDQIEIEIGSESERGA